ncbi:CoA transferase [Halieaceae bacterium IMCC14734]|uniref:CoA transferase n=1 Tax=Candidatus Litorirhabdus singularis TaxID=2518993 RepID=A0ABT3TCV0_9GAMM|nr:CoA transferase [Candidatus Litorirhabdus singularis]MCX2979307.1 CoA transferase [Candidatus Litorirhabdus singularis]
MSTPGRPLRGIKVVDLTSVISGPYCTMLMGDQGAEVIKVERPGVGDFSRHLLTSRNGLSALFANLNRNKKSVALNLDIEAGKQALIRLAAEADVLVENFRPGVMQKLGLDYPRIKTINPQLIYVSINGFGSNGPRASEPAYDTILQAMIGMIEQQRAPDTGEVDLIRTALCDKVTGITATQSICAALYEREKWNSGGCRMELAMLDACLSFFWPDGMTNQTFIGEGVDLQRRLSESSRLFPTADGHLVLSAVQPKEIEGLCRALNASSLLSEPRFATTELRVKNFPDWEQCILEHVRQFTSNELVPRLKSEGVPHARVQESHAVPQDSQVLARELISEQEHPRSGLYRSVRHPAVVNGNLGGHKPTAPPALGEHTREVFAALGYQQEHIDALIAG